MGETPLIRCAHNGHLKSVEFLIEHGADVNALDLVSSLGSLFNVPRDKLARSSWSGFVKESQDVLQCPPGKHGQLDSESLKCMGPLAMKGPPGINLPHVLETYLTLLS